MFHVLRFEPHTCIVIEGFGTLEMHLLLLLLVSTATTDCTAKCSL